METLDQDGKEDVENIRDWLLCMSKGGTSIDPCGDEQKGSGPDRVAL